MTNAHEVESYDVFISYRHSSSGFYMARLIYDRLIYNGYTVFLDKDMGTCDFDTEIETAISKSRNFIVVIFPGDLDGCSNADDWLKREAECALRNPDITIIPVLCDKFPTEDDKKIEFPDCFNVILSSKNGIAPQKDYTLDQTLDELCDARLKNVAPIKPLINTKDFFNKNLNPASNLQIVGVDLAFHGGGAFLTETRDKVILDELVSRKIPTRVLINDPKVAKEFTQHMRNPGTSIGPSPFKTVAATWKKFAKEHPDTLKVRVCKSPLLHVHHAVRYHNTLTQKPYGRQHIKYYAHRNYDIGKAFEHELSSFSKYYELYSNEFEYLWSISKPI